MKTKDRIFELMEIGFKIGTGFFPGPVSAAFNAFYDAFKNGILSERAEKWKKDVIERLEKLETEYDLLINNESFASALIRTSELAIKTESNEKREMLANALINTYSNNVDEDKVIIFLNLIEKYTFLHIKIIKYLHDEFMQEKFFNNEQQRYMTVFTFHFRDTDSSYVKKAVYDLQNDYLIEKTADDANIQFGHLRFKQLTKLGNDFYDFLIQTKKEKTE